MYIDSELEFDDNDAHLSSAASKDYVDTLAAGDAISPGAKVVAKISTAYVDAGGGTIVATLQTSDDSSFGSYTTLLTGPTVTIAAGAATAAGAVGVTLMDAVIPPGVLRYLRMYYTMTAMDAGSIDARIVLDSDKLLDKGL
jgi:hypothetical protein